VERRGEIDRERAIPVFRLELLDRREVPDEALLTRMSTPPNSASAVSTSEVISGGLARSAP
jgi:hypothetical protein